MIECRSSLADPRGNAQEWITRTLTESAAAHQQILLLCSGGSALSILPETVPKEILPEAITISLVDERWCADARNFDALTQTPFVRSLHSRGATLIPVVTETGRTPQAAASDFAQRLSGWRARMRGPSAVVVIAGIGKDGHTAGIFPYPNDPQEFAHMFMGPQQVVAYTHEYAPMCPERITLSASYLTRQVDRALLYATGADKAGAISQTLAATDSYATVPARVFHAVRQCVLMTDQSA
jgi:6-phosphogluconolactonase/glucosamine-6-phosphate isomerase/deaminase